MGKKAHVVVFPCPSQGHVNGMMNFAAYLAANYADEVQVTFIHSARNYARLTSCTSLHRSGINMVALPDGVLHPPACAHTTSSSQTLHDEHYFNSIHTMVSGLGALLSQLQQQDNPVTCLVADTLLPGSQLVATSFGIPWVAFWTSSAACFYICLHLPQLISHGYLPLPDTTDIEAHLEDTMVDLIRGIPPFPLVEMTKEIQVTDVDHPWVKFMLQSFCQVQNANRVLVHSFYDIEPRIFDAARVELGLPMYPVGPLLMEEAAGLSLLREDKKCLEWLDQQEAASVILVSFGSCASLSAEEIQELGLGLQASEQPFLLVLRPGSYEGSRADIMGGIQQLGGSSCLVSDWVPQRAVLAHPAVGGFMSHCGWNSTLESMWMGVPLIGCPRGSEQRANVRYITHDWKVGIAGPSPLRMSCLAVERAVRSLMQGEEGRQARARALQLRDTARKSVAQGGLSKCCVDEFIKDMQAF